MATGFDYYRNEDDVPKPLSPSQNFGLGSPALRNNLNTAATRANPLESALRSTASIGLGELGIDRNRVNAAQAQGGLLGASANLMQQKDAIAANRYNSSVPGAVGSAVRYLAGPSAGATAEDLLTIGQRQPTAPAQPSLGMSPQTTSPRVPENSNIPTKAQVLANAAQKPPAGWDFQVMPQGGRNFTTQVTARPDLNGPAADPNLVRSPLTPQQLQSEGYTRSGLGLRTQAQVPQVPMRAPQVDTSRDFKAVINGAPYYGDQARMVLASQPIVDRDPNTGEIRQVFNTQAGQNLQQGREAEMNLYGNLARANLDSQTELAKQQMALDAATRYGMNRRSASGPSGGGDKVGTTNREIRLGNRNPKTGVEDTFNVPVGTLNGRPAPAYEALPVLADAASRSAAQALDGGWFSRNPTQNELIRRGGQEFDRMAIQAGIPPLPKGIGVHQGHLMTHDGRLVRYNPERGYEVLDGEE